MSRVIDYLVANLHFLFEITKYFPEFIRIFAPDINYSFFKHL